MSHEIAIVAIPGVQLLDVCGPLDVFAEANRLLKRQVYSSRIISVTDAEVQASSGVRLNADLLLENSDNFTPHTLLIAGAPGIADFAADESTLHALTGLCERSQRFGSVCSGALLLARTGLLQGKRVTTHWECAGLLAALYPEITVDADALCVADGRVRTAAGVTSGLDLALRLVEEDLGRDVAMEIAAHLVMFFRRPVNQTHFMRSNGASLNGRSALQELQRWAISHLAEVKTVAMMAEHMAISERHMTRLFRQAIGMTPGQWLERERVAKAKQLLEQKSLPAKALALQCGFSGADVMRRVFSRVTGMTPSAYSKMNAKS
ncbi:AraC family transcriptional regulator [Pantoea sp. RIT-PI-b]|uniref:GlxA family transcriptional regulator n=1 Tax=Pantoea sp. RIT-PI-b TaxID=1681195 RepID=UPI0006762D39|nr:helix-turn-helix domain-containing protein [Pantoea sp. RIT-PI-b]KNC05896.1 AraC family transcriptional regulator [Pantoea sp. RIT-PI-b]